METCPLSVFGWRQVCALGLVQGVSVWRVVVGLGGLRQCVCAIGEGKMEFGYDEVEKGGNRIYLGWVFLFE